MKAVLISIRPRWVELIASGKKTVEIRKTRPKLETPFKCYIYETKGKVERARGDEDGYIYQEGCGAVVGEFVCDSIYNIINVGNAFIVGKTTAETTRVARASCLDFGDMHDYLGHKGGYGWHISALKLYDKPKKLSEFEKACDHENDCGTCKWFSVNYACTNSISRQPQSYMYVEEMTT